MDKKTNQRIDRYVSKLKRSLNHLSQTDRDDIAREIEGHIAERWEVDSNGAFDDESLSGVFGKMGTPESLAAQYCEQRGWALPPPKHTLRNTILAALAIILLFVFGMSYIATRYVISPIVDLISGKGKIIKVDEKGVDVLNGMISVKEGKDGNDEVRVNIPGSVDIQVSDDEDGVEINFDTLLKMKNVAEEKGVYVDAAGSADSIALDVKNAKLVLKGADTNDVKIEFTKTAHGSDAKAGKEALEAVKITHSVEGSTFVVDSVYPRKYPDGVSSVSLDLTITVPEKMEAAIDVKNYKLVAENLGGRVKLNAKNGSAKISKIGGAAISMKNGSVDIENTGGDVSVDMKNGSVSIKDARGDIEVDSKMGSVNIALAKGYEFTLEGESMMGKINCDFPVERDGNEVSAKIGSGRHELRVESKMGSVNIERGK